METPARLAITALICIISLLIDQIMDLISNNAPTPYLNRNIPSAPAMICRAQEVIAAFNSDETLTLFTVLNSHIKFILFSVSLLARHLDSHTSSHPPNLQSHRVAP
jgi:hypothetical protein